VYFNDRVCGAYDKKGHGEINSKPIRVIKAPGKAYLLLVELRA
jgi:hypothetical protein